MDSIIERCCGLDVHKKSVVACAVTPEGQEVRTFRTMTKDLLELSDWPRRVTHAAWRAPGSMEAGPTICWRRTSPSGWSTHTT